MSRLEELKEKFRSGRIVGRGLCLIIPIEKFKPEWDEDLLNEGLECHSDKGFVYVHLPKTTINAEKVREQGHIVKSHGSWTDKEDEVLIKLWNNKKIKVKDIHKRYVKLVVNTDRTEKAIINRLQRLRKAGKIKPRHKYTRKTEEQEKGKETHQAEPKLPDPQSVAIATGNGEKTLRLAGWIYALYIDTNFIEYFVTAEQAKKYAEVHYKNLAHFIKPVAFFKYSS